MNFVPVALIGLIDRYLGGLLDSFVTLLEVHKLVYFMKISGEPSLGQLRFVKGDSGPYSENLTSVLRKVEGYFISGFRDGGDEPYKQLELVPGAVKGAAEFLGENPGTRARCDKVSSLVEGL